ncbi:MAG: hypothetical protein CME58_11415 [Halieaceae bacterium]|nr:hypothetical protein [Halieaceae bacterium]
MESFSLPLAGGLLLGSAAIWLLLSMGRIAGISGVIWGALTGPDRQWRWVFLIGLLIGGALTHFATGMPLPAPSNAPLWLIALSGLLVGVGTRMGSGCTSGHGVCGLGRRSPRSLTATLTFMALGVFTVTVMQALQGGAA